MSASEHEIGLISLYMAASITNFEQVRQSTSRFFDCIDPVNITPLSPDAQLTEVQVSKFLETLKKAIPNPDNLTNGIIAPLILGLTGLQNALSGLGKTPPKTGICQ